MIQNKKVLAVIPARGGSKGMPRKNIYPVQGKPLIAWTIEQAKASNYIDRLILSSEDEEIIKIARDWGCDVPFIRPQYLAQDKTPGIDPVLHALEQLPEFDYVILLQPTSPLRTTQDIDTAIENCIQKGANSCVSVCEASESPYWMFNLYEGKLLPLIDGASQIARRQELPKSYLLNGAIYIARCEWLQQNKSFLTSETIAYVMDSTRSLDIDTEEDLVLMEHYIKHLTKSQSKVT